MGSISEILIEIEHLLDLGHEPRSIAVMLDIPVEWVYSIEEGEFREEKV
jgi:hypothetical protein